MVGIFIAPRRTFTALRAETQYEDWLVPMLVVIIVGMIGGHLLFPDALEKSVFEQLQQFKNLDKKNWSMYLTNARLTGSNSAYANPIITAILIFLVAVFYWGIVRFLFRGNITYKQVLAVINYSFLVQVPEAIITVPLAMAKEVTRVQIRLELLIPESLEGIAFFDHLALISVFEMWKYSLLGLGLIMVGGNSIENSEVLFIHFLPRQCLVHNWSGVGTFD